MTIDHDKIALETIFHEAQTQKEREDAILRLEAGEWLMQKIRDARESPLELLKLCFRAKGGGPIIVPDFYKEWDQLFRFEPRFTIAAPRGTGKSIFVQAALLWATGRNQNMRIKLLGESDAKSGERLQTIHTIVDSPNHIYHLIFPDVKKAKLGTKRPNAVTTFNLERQLIAADHTIEARGVLNMATGGRASLVVFDDIVGRYNSIDNPSLKPKVLDKVRDDWWPIMTGDCLVWCVYTPWSLGDVNDYLRQHTDWPHFFIAHGEPGNPYKSCFPQLWPDETLKERRKIMGEVGYARAYLLNLHTEESSMLQPEHLRPMTRKNYTRDKALSSTTIISADPASGKEMGKSKSSRLDPTGISVHHFVETSPDKGLGFEVFISDAFEDYIDIPSQSKLLWHMAITYNAQYILCEAEAMADLHLWLVRDRKDMIKEFSASGESPPWALRHCKVLPIKTRGTSKGQRLKSVSSLFNPPDGDPPVLYFHPRVVEQGPQKVTLNVPGVGDISILRNFREQVLAFPARHDDILDSVTQALIWSWRVLAPKQDRSEDDEDDGGLISGVLG